MPTKKSRQVKGGAGSSGSSSSPACAPTVQFLDAASTLMCLVYPTIETLNLALGRISYFFENKKYKNQYIPLSQWRSMPQTSGMTYEGHNFPVSLVLKWLAVAPENDWAEGERLLLNLLISRKLLFKDRKGKWHTACEYIIAGMEGDSETFRHELMHALYFSHPDYRDLVTEVFEKDVPAHLLSLVQTYITSKGYSLDVMQDEFQAYLCCDDKDVVGGKKNAATKSVAALKKKLRSYQATQVDWVGGWANLMTEGEIGGAVLAYVTAGPDTCTGKGNEEKKNASKGHKKKGGRG